ncbi:hypothetical protein ES288_A08G100300v1 [Gossypium darwinii]|uniref:Uncharacterized protein n=1 Tax=Gossypium darwinii TaxID=34276 RepID=A0A5D2FJM0_GOSDA|nr:hypothetical protein ES288_A08G100300v1 [Gossypium darwinii]
MSEKETFHVLQVVDLSVLVAASFRIVGLCLTYLAQRLEYRFHMEQVIGSNPIVGKTSRNPCFCQHDSKYRLATRSQLNDQSIGYFHLNPTPLFYSSCTWATHYVRTREAENPNEKLFNAPHDSFKKHSLRRFHSCPYKKRGFKIPGDQVKVNSPRKSSKECTSSKKN